MVESKRERGEKGGLLSDISINKEDEAYKLFYNTMSSYRDAAPGNLSCPETPGNPSYAIQWRQLNLRDILLWMDHQP